VAPPADSRSQLRVALVAGSLGLGGAEKQLAFMARTLAGAGVAVRVYALTRGEHYEGVLQKAGIPLTWIGRFRSPALRLLALVRGCVAFRPHIVQSTHFFANLYAALASRACGAVSIGAIRNDVVHEFEANGRWSPWLLRSADGLIVNSEVGLRATRDLGIAPERIVRVPNVVDLCPGSSAGGNRPPGDRVVVACVARLVQPKRLDRFLRVLAAARRSWPAVHGLVVGDGPDGPGLVKLADTLGLLPDGVEFAGRRLDVPVLLPDVHILALTSDHEGLPNVLLEAMAAALPVVTTAAGDAASVVDDGVTGYVVPVDAEDAFARRIVDLARSPALRRRLGIAGRQKVARDYGDASLGPRLLRAYAQFAEQARWLAGARLKSRLAASTVILNS